MKTPLIIVALVIMILATLVGISLARKRASLLHIPRFAITYTKENGLSAMSPMPWSDPEELVIDVNFVDDKPHWIAFEFAGDGLRKTLVQACDKTGSLIETQQITKLDKDRRLTAQQTGYMQYRFTRLSGPDVRITGIFFDSVPPEQRRR